MSQRPEWMQIIQGMTLQAKQARIALRTNNKELTQLDEHNSIVDAETWQALEDLAAEAGIPDLQAHVDANKMRCDWDNTVAEMAEELEFMIGGE